LSQRPPEASPRGAGGRRRVLKEAGVQGIHRLPQNKTCPVRPAGLHSRKKELLPPPALTHAGGPTYATRAETEAAGLKDPPSRNALCKGWLDVNKLNGASIPHVDATNLSGEPANSRRNCLSLSAHFPPSAYIHFLNFSYKIYNPSPATKHAENAKDRTRFVKVGLADTR